MHGVKSCADVYDVVLFCFMLRVIGVYRPHSAVLDQVISILDFMP